ncbi:hypothetical protein CWC05_14150 [Pseudoalteromonas ruthenica]|uniref:Uncharacterized protein n=1 Tax=Pseudoalteromonas ruthenica TaxID=151081 RepID=A0A5S3Z3X5_9GAMM|nr:hypothetical protein CWC05_14150 [Pseudoalteromonas ruthenica]
MKIKLIQLQQQIVSSTFLNEAYFKKDFGVTQKPLLQKTKQAIEHIPMTSFEALLTFQKRYIITYLKQ